MINEGDKNLRKTDAAGRKRQFKIVLWTIIVLFILIKLLFGVKIFQEKEGATIELNESRSWMADKAPRNVARMDRLVISKELSIPVEKNDNEDLICKVYPEDTIVEIMTEDGKAIPADCEEEGTTVIPLGLNKLRWRIHADDPHDFAWVSFERKRAR